MSLAFDFDHGSIASNRLKRPILLVGNFQFHEGHSLDCSKLAASLIENGTNLTTASSQNEGICQRHMSFSTPMKSQRSTEFLQQYDSSIVFLKSFLKTQESSINYWRQAKEIKRKIQFLNDLSYRSKELILIGSIKEKAIIALIKKHTHIEQLSPTAAPKELYNKFVHKGTMILDLEQAKTTLYNHAFFSIPSQEVGFSESNKSFDRDQPLQKIFEIACSPKLRNSFFAKRLRNLNSQDPDKIHITSPPFPIKQVTMERPENSDFPRYALHLRSLFKLENEYPLGTKKQKIAFKDWYHKFARERTPCYWTPLIETPSSNIAPAKQKCSTFDLINFLEGSIEITVLPFDAQKALSHKPYKQGPSGIAILLALLARHPKTQESFVELWECAEIAKWYKSDILPLLPNLRETPEILPSNKPIPKTVDLIGIGQGHSGLSQNFRMMTKALKDLNVTFRKRDFEALFSGEKISSKTNRLIKNSFAIHAMNADRIPLSLTTPNFYRRNDIYHVGFCLWETSELPNLHKLGVEMLDEVWVPSRFVESLYNKQRHIEVQNIGKGIPQLDSLFRLSTDKPKWSKTFQFFCAFDFHSSIERKNPLATLQAFQRAFPARIFPDLRLTFKSTKPEIGHWGDPNGQREKIVEATMFDQRIELIEDHWSEAKMLRAIAYSDCVVSSHRAEGFGYLPLYALAAACPLIVTDWGGTQDFCSNETAFLVNADLVKVPKSHSIHDAKGAHWADVNVTKLKDTMQNVYTNREDAKARANAGRDYVNQTYSMDAFKIRIQNRLSELNLI